MTETEENLNPNYFGIIPANVRYDKELSANAKLLYSELTCLANKEGFCFASNNYFAKLYAVTPSVISKRIKQLADKSYIHIEYDYEDKICVRRRIYINKKDKKTENNQGGVLQNLQGGIAQNARGVLQNLQGGYCTECKYNNTSINNTRVNNTSLKREKKKFIPPTLEEVEKYIQEKKYSVNAKTFFDYYEATGWKDKDGKQVLSWKGRVVSWQSREKKNLGNKIYAQKCDRFSDEELKEEIPF